MRKNSIFFHSILMVIKNKKAYLMLSVTILLTFVFFLSYMVHVDSKIMSENISQIKSDSSLIRIYSDTQDKSYNLFLDKLSDYKQTSFYVYKMISNANTSNGFRGDIIVLPREPGSVFSTLDNQIELVNGSKIRLEKNQAVVREEDYRKLKKQCKGKKIYYNLPIELVNGNVRYIKVEIIGAYKSKIEEKYGRGSIESILISQDTVSEYACRVIANYILIHTKQPQKIISEAKNLGVNYESTYEEKKYAYKEIRGQIKNKAIIAMVLFALLGINLSSSFKNTLSDRKYEIGVKRAIGASKKDIILQFMYEGIVVVIINILISILITGMLFSIYKCYMCNIKNMLYIIYVSKYSLLMFGIVSIFLTIAFSIIFAVQSSQVEIIKYIKGE